MSGRQTRAASKKQVTPTKKREEAEDGLMEDGFSVVDTDHKAQKGKEAKAKDGEKGEESQQAGEENQTGNETMDTTDHQQESVSGANDSVTDATVNSESAANEEGNPGGEESKGEQQQQVDGEQTGDGQKGEKQDGEKPAENGKEKKARHPVVWVSNISRHVKATDLKKHFSKHGKVVTAKIVTNGKNFFGYVCLDSLESVDVCVQNLNNSDFEGRKINVTVDKPVRDDKIIRKKEPEVTGNKDPLTTIYDEAEKKAEEGKGEEKKSRSPSRRKVDTSKMTAEQLKKEVAMCEREIDRLRHRLIEEQARCRLEIKRSRRMERDLQDADSKIRDDRRRYERERDEWSKKSRLEQLRLDAERVIIERDREEMRRAREEFERDLRRFLEDQQRAAMERPRGGPVSPPPPKRFRGDDGPGDAKGPWVNETPGAGSNAGQQGGRGQYFSGGAGGNPWNSNQGGGQWRGGNMGNAGNSQAPPYFRGDGGYGRNAAGGGGGGYGASNDGGFRSGPFENTGRKF